MESYDQVVKKLIKIIQLKSDDNVKQLEDLWESLNCNSKVPSAPVAVVTAAAAAAPSPAPAPTEPSLKRALSEVNELSAAAAAASAKKPKLVAQAAANKVSPPKAKPLTVSKAKIDSTDQSSSSSSLSSTSDKSSSSSCNLNDLFDVEMLDFSCCVCKQLKQETNNQLFECRKCTKLYHQKCHHPRIDETKTLLVNDEEDKLLWFIEKCQMCAKIVNEEDEQTRMSPNQQQVKGLAALANKFSNKIAKPSEKKQLLKQPLPLPASSTTNQKNLFNVISVKK